MTDNETNKKNVHAVIEAGEIETLSKDFFRIQGGLGGKKRWKGKTKEEIKTEMEKVRKHKLST